MITPSDPHHNYNIQQDFSYQAFENANSLPTNAIAYKLMGDLAFRSMISGFPDILKLRVCDVGCFMGGTTARWLSIGQAYLSSPVRVQVLGTDIYRGNITYAKAKYQSLTDLQFKVMTAGGNIPRIDQKAYHLMFAAFVLDVIPAFEDVRALCNNMVNALITDGEIYLLRLHPHALTSGARFQEYSITARTAWHHGDPLTIHLTNQAHHTIRIEDTFWEPEQIAEIFIAQACEVNLINLSLSDESPVATLLKKRLMEAGLPVDMPEWNIPLYQVIQVKKR